MTELSHVEHRVDVTFEEANSMHVKVTSIVLVAQRGHEISSVLGVHETFPQLPRILVTPATITITCNRVVILLFQIIARICEVLFGRVQVDDLARLACQRLQTLDARAAHDRLVAAVEFRQRFLYERHPELTIARICEYNFTPKQLTKNYL